MAHAGIGTVVALHLCLGHRQPMRSVTQAAFVAGHGIQGDRHASSNGHSQKRQVLLMDAETLAAYNLQPGQLRENVTTQGVELAAIPVGSRLTLGGAVLEITGGCTPCYRMDELRDGLRHELEGRRGILARVVGSGTVRFGDTLQPLPAATTVKLQGR
jgi:MOSC domain-containing protein YiiM